MLIKTHYDGLALPVDLTFFSIFVGTGELFLTTEPSLPIFEVVAGDVDVVEDGEVGSVINLIDRPVRCAIEVRLAGV